MSDKQEYSDCDGRMFYYDRGFRVYLDGGEDTGAKVKFTPTRPVRDAVPRERLKERVHCYTAEEASKEDHRQLGLGDVDDEGTPRPRPCAEWAARWVEFVSEMQPGDEIWFFEMPDPGPMSACAGFAMVRQGKPIDAIVTFRS
jgi:hypothetical protein